MKDFSQMPQRLHEYPASDRAKEIVKKSMAMDTLFSGIWPGQWSSPEAPEFHDVMDKMKAASFKVLGACPSADALGGDFMTVVKALQFYLKKINERPESYKIVRTTRDIDQAVAEGKLGIYFTHQGTKQFEEDLDRVLFFRQLGYGYCLIETNQNRGQTRVRRLKISQQPV